MTCHQCGQTKQKQCNWFSKIKPSQFQKEDSSQFKVALVGNPNVGKSALFNALTGHYVTVSNYPGTTVEVSQGKMNLGEQSIMIIDTPGMYSLIPITEEERVARNLLLTTSLDLIVHVVDATNLGRMLPLTFELMEADLPVILAINMMDEVERIGMRFSREELARKLEIPVITLSAALGFGIHTLKRRVLMYVQNNSLSSPYRRRDISDRVSLV